MEMTIKQKEFNKKLQELLAEYADCVVKDNTEYDYYKNIEIHIGDY